MLLSPVVLALSRIQSGHFFLLSFASTTPYALALSTRLASPSSPSLTLAPLPDLSF